MESPLDIRQISKSFSDHTVLDDISLTLQTGEIFGLIGLNGIGKTTLIKIILNLLRPDEGDITIYGKSWQDTAAKYELAYLPEKFQPSRLLTGQESLELALSYHGKPYHHDQACAEAAELGLDPNVLSRRVSSYSKGMGQKIGLIAALMLRTSLVILDEPMSGLDPMARIQLKRRLHKAKESGQTLFFSSHILADIEEICDRIAILHDGKFQYLGPTAAFMEQYKDITLEQAFLDVTRPDERSLAASA